MVVDTRYSRHPYRIEWRPQPRLIGHRECAGFGHQRQCLTALELNPRLDHVLKHRAERITLGGNADRCRQDMMAMRDDRYAGIVNGVTVTTAQADAFLKW